MPMAGCDCIPTQWTVMPRLTLDMSVREGSRSGMKGTCPWLGMVVLGVLPHSVAKGTCSGLVHSSSAFCT